MTEYFRNTAEINLYTVIKHQSQILKSLSYISLLTLLGVEKTAKR